MISHDEKGPEQESKQQESSNPPASKYFRLGAKRNTSYSGGWARETQEDLKWETLYKKRWQYEKVVRSTHGVNCTGSCSWLVYVKDGTIAWEMQATDYPNNGPDHPDYEPRGCPRGASFSWYVYSPLRIKHPYVRGALLDLWHAAKSRNATDPVKAWEEIVNNPESVNSYRRSRGKGGFVRASWNEVNEIISASLVHTIQRYGPDRIFGMSPIPAMSMVSYAAGTRFLSLIGGVSLSFYDFYCDLSIASPQIWGEQTDVPESADWFNSGYIIMWGSNVPQTRTPDAHFMTEARYRGTKVIAVAPDYAENVKFADQWLAPSPGTDGALALAMAHVILKEFYVERPVPYFLKYATENTDLPFLVILKKKGDDNGSPLFEADRFLRASDLGSRPKELNAEWKTVVYDPAKNVYAVPNGSLGFRWGENGKWNLDLVDSSSGSRIEPALTLLGVEDEVVMVEFPFYGSNGARAIKRSAPARRISTAGGGDVAFVTTVYDLLLASMGVSRGLGGDYGSYDDASSPYTPAWQESITGVDRSSVEVIAREFARNAELTHGKSMVILGAGVNHWYHSDQIYRAILTLVVLTGSEGVNGGGWAHYVGQEKVRPFEGFAALAFALDWQRPPRRQNTTSYAYFASDQWRYEDILVQNMRSPVPGHTARYDHPADYNALAVRLGWLPFYPQFNKNPLISAPSASAASADDEELVGSAVRALKAGTLDFAVNDPDSPEDFSRVMFVWRSNFLFSAGKGSEYYLKHLVGTTNSVMAGESTTLPKEIKRREAPQGKLDLLVTLDFRMSSTALYSDIVLPAATWYEKFDLSTTDMHPFVHPFTPAIEPPWEARSDWDIFSGIAKTFSTIAGEKLGKRKDLVMVPLMHDSPDELAQPLGQVKDWKKGETEPIPGRTMPRLVIVERDYGATFERMTSLGPLIADKPFGAKGIAWSAKEEYEGLKKTLGVRRLDRSGDPVATEYPDISQPRRVAEAILSLSGATNGHVAAKSWKSLGSKTGLELESIIQDEEKDAHYRFSDLVAQPRKVLDTPIDTGITTGKRTYSAFTVNTEKRVPWRTLTGRQHFYLDHEIIREFGEGLPIYLPPPDVPVFREDLEKRPEKSRENKELVLRYMTPHGKWNVHSMWTDNLHMLTLFRGGPVIWLNHEDAGSAGIRDNEWLEVFNRNGVVTARAVLSHRIPKGSAIMYHVQDRTVNVKKSRISGGAGGSHNSPTRIHVKPTQMIGGYAQLSYEFNYYGPVGSQRDAFVVVRKLLAKTADSTTTGVATTKEGWAEG